MPSETMRYGMGFWPHPTSRTMLLAGHDPDVSCRGAHNPSTATTYLVIGSTSTGAWPLARYLDGELAG